MKKPAAIVEQWAHWIVAFAVICAHHFLRRSLYPIPEQAKDMFGAVSNIAGIAIGFLATGQALLCSLTDNFVVKTLKELNLFDRMLRLFTVAIHWCLVLAVFSLATFWIDFKVKDLLFSIWLGIFFGAFVATLRILLLFSKVLHGKKPR